MLGRTMLSTSDGLDDLAMVACCVPRTWMIQTAVVAKAGCAGDSDSCPRFMCDVVCKANAPSRIIKAGHTQPTTS